MMYLDAVLSFISAIILAGVGAYVFMKGINRISETFLELILFLFLWAFGNAMSAQWGSWEVREGIIFWDNILFLGVTFTSAAWFHLASTFTGLLNKRWYIVPSYLFSALFFLFYISGSLNWYPHTQDPQLLHPNVTYWIFVTGSFLIIFIGILLYVLYYRKAGKKGKEQALIMVISAFFPILGNVLYNIYLFYEKHFTIDPTIPSFAIMGILFTYGITYLSLFEVTIFDPSFVTTLFENLNDAVFFLAKDGWSPITNPEATSLTGYTQEELKNMKFEGLVHPQERSMVTLELEEMMKGNLSLKHHEFRIQRKEGEAASVDASFKIQKKGGEIIGALCVMRDVSEKKRNEEKLSAIYELSRRMSLAFDINEIVDIVLDACEKVLKFGYCLIFLIDHEKRELYTIGRRGVPKTKDMFKLPLDSEKGITVASVREGETIYVPDVRKDERHVEGAMPALSELCVPLKVGGKIIGVLAMESFHTDGFTKEDIILAQTLASSAAIAVENARLFEQVAKSNKLKEMFLSIISHDLKNPLAIIRGYNELLSGMVEEKAKAYTKKIEEGVLRMVDMIDMVRLYTRVGDESYKKGFERGGLGDLIESAITFVSDKAAQKNVSVFFEKRNPTILAHKTLENVFINIIDNAIKYSPPQSSVEIEIEEKGEVIKVFVKDFGRGIPDEFKEKVFGKFERGKVEGIEGSGLGLAIAREIIIHHAGKIWVEDNPEGGSVFCVELPKPDSLENG